MLTKPEETFLIFTDAATSSKNNYALGAFVCLNESSLKIYNQFNAEKLLKNISEKIIYKNFQTNKCTFAEIKTAIDALHFLQKHSGNKHKVMLYTDCQSLCDLLRRQEKLEKNNFITSSGKILKHADLYIEFFNIIKNFDIQIIKLKGHTPHIKLQTLEQKIFATVDKLTRKMLRINLQNFNIS